MAEEITRTIENVDRLFSEIVVNGEYKFDLDDGKTRVKDVLVKREDGSFVDL